MSKIKNKKCKCKFCDSYFMSADVKSKICDSCRIKESICPKCKGINFCKKLQLQNHRRI